MGGRMMVWGCFPPPQTLDFPLGVFVEPLVSSLVGEGEGVWQPGGGPAPPKRFFLQRGLL